MMFEISFENWFVSKMIIEQHLGDFSVSAVAGST